MDYSSYFSPDLGQPFPEIKIVTETYIGILRKKE